ncbi:sigma-70 family RNA polymerase sigma factor [Perlabentimonas gracilis]|uniref:sigma-70 family RNA polymerase sigma factor n=1 Tax=Perlabentimonas gracilis TaxID=2715279 RepID=UPI00140B7C26|nr:sigma-70 family RNA polymerase sigma factor [Perlabentimonas gracilis]NHB67124.1 sigma-70 family RNA polymerase sigma factor [Perlabentimonas gracilis]
MRIHSNNSIEAISMETIVDIAGKVVSKYVFRSVIPHREKEDVVMSMVEKFIRSRSKIESSFEGKAKATTYIVAILNRMCCEVIRKESRHWYSIDEEELFKSESNQSTLPIEAEKSYAISNEVNRLNTALLFFNEDLAKLKVFLRCLFDLPYNPEEIAEYAGSKAQQVTVLLDVADQGSKGDKFEVLSKVVNFVEGKNVKGDAVRMWLNKQIDAILNRLNRNGISNHNKESLAILMELQQAKN